MTSNAPTYLDRLKASNKQSDKNKAQVLEMIPLLLMICNLMALIYVFLNKWYPESEMPYEYTTVFPSVVIAIMTAGYHSAVGSRPNLVRSSQIWVGVAGVLLLLAVFLPPRECCKKADPGRSCNGETIPKPWIRELLEGITLLHISIGGMIMLYYMLRGRASNATNTASARPGNTPNANSRMGNASTDGRTGANNGTNS